MVSHVTEEGERLAPHIASIASSRASESSACPMRDKGLGQVHVSRSSAFQN